MTYLKILCSLSILVLQTECVKKNVFEMKFNEQCIPGLTDQCYRAGNDSQVRDHFESVERKTNHVVNFVIDEMYKAKLDNNPGWFQVAEAKGYSAGCCAVRDLKNSKFVFEALNVIIC